MRASTVQVESEIVDVAPNGRHRVRFKAVEPDKVRPSIAEMVTLWDRCVTERSVHPLVGLAASNLDFLCIHPFRGRKRPRVALVVAASVLPSGLRCRALHQF